MPKKPPEDKAKKHETRGDAYLEKGKSAKALGEYRKAQSISPALPGIYDKLIRAHDASRKDWQKEDFAESVAWAMEKQAQENPPIRQVHAKLTPEWREAEELALRILAAPPGEDHGADIERLVGMGQIASRVLIEILIDLKEGRHGPGEQSGAEGE